MPRVLAGLVVLAVRQNAKERDDVTAANDNEDDVLDIPGACKLLRMGKNTIYEACGRGEMPHRKIGNRIRFSRAALLRWLDSCGGSAGAHERH